MKKGSLIALILALGYSANSQFVAQSSTDLSGVMLTHKGGLEVYSTLSIGGSDLILGARDLRNQGTKQFNRAMVHTDWGIGSDNLIMNFDGDFEGGINIQGRQLIVDGKLGIGTLFPAANAKLDIEGGALNIGSSATTADAALHIKTSYGGWDRLTQMHPSLSSKPALNLMASTDAATNYNWWSWGVLTSGSWALQPSSGFGGTTGLFIDRNGNVSIGNTSPDAKLSVSGQVHATEVKVTLSVPGPDYVFEPTYTLPSLDFVQSYINQNKHLPEVPSAKEMESNGLNIGEMNMVLLKKVEELTLYMIEFKKEKEKIEKINCDLLERVQALEKKKPQ